MHTMVLFYEDGYTQSLFTALTNLHSNAILPIRLDGATKEFFAWDSVLDL